MKPDNLCEIAQLDGVECDDAEERALAKRIVRSSIALSFRGLVVRFFEWRNHITGSTGAIAIIDIRNVNNSAVEKCAENFDRGRKSTQLRRTVNSVVIFIARQRHFANHEVRGFYSIRLKLGTCKSAGKEREFNIAV